MIKISVIVPSYKPDSYFWRCLDSLLVQTMNHNEFEIIIVLNGCRDPWEHNIKEYINSYFSLCHIQYCQTDVPGVSNARNIGLKKARGEYITFIDDDDCVSPNYLSGLLINANEEIVSISNTLAFIGDGEPFSYRLSYNFDNVGVGKMVSINKARVFFSGPCMKLIHRSIIAGREFNTLLSNGEDTLFMFVISDRIKRVQLTKEDVYYYRRFRENSATTRFRSENEKRQSEFIQLKALIKTYIKHPFKYNFFFFCTRIMSCIRFVVKPV